MHSLILRIHEWLADHVHGIQYPNVRQVRAPQGALFRYQMPWWKRLAILQVGITALIFLIPFAIVSVIFGFLILKACVQAILG